MRKFGSTYVAIGVVLALGAYILFVEGVGTPSKDAGNLLVDVPAGDVTRVTIDGSSGRVELAKTSGDGKDSWRIESPKAVAASSTAVKILVDAATRLACEKKIADEAGKDGLATYGLEPPWLSVTVHTDKGDKTILVGAETPVGGARYAKLAESGAVYTIASSTVSELAKKLDDLRERNVFPFESDAVSTLRLTAPGGLDVRLEKQAAGEDGEEDWHIAYPFQDVADKWKVSDIVWDLAGLTVSEFVDDEGKDLAKWGLEQPRLRVEAEGQDRDTVFELLVGSEAPDGKGFYVRTSDSPSVYLVNPASFSPLDIGTGETGANDLLKRELLSWNDDDLLRVTLEDQGKAISFLRNGDEWKAVPPSIGAAVAAGALPKGVTAGQTPEVRKEGETWQVKAGEEMLSRDDMSRLWTALRDIAVASVDRGSRAGAHDARYGLDRPRIRVELDLGDGNVLELKVGKQADHGEGLYATATGRNLVYIVDGGRVQALREAVRTLMG